MIATGDPSVAVLLGTFNGERFLEAYFMMISPTAQNLLFIKKSLALLGHQEWN
jgi:hypothetical protein